MAASPASLSERIQSLILEIEAIKAELRYPASDPRTGLAIPKVPDAVVQDFKYSVDQLRLFLWAYLDTRSEGGLNPDTRMQQIRTESAAEMLNLLCKDFGAKGVPRAPEVSRLRDQLRHIATILSDEAA